MSSFWTGFACGTVFTIIVCGAYIAYKLISDIDG